MVPDKKTRPGCVALNGSSPGKSCDLERQADQDLQGISSDRQKESEIFVESDTAARRLWAAVLVRVIRDLCGHDRQLAQHTYNWVRSNQFKTLCDYAEMDESFVRQTIDGLWSLPQSIRHSMLKEIIRKTVDSVMRAPKKKEPA